MKIDIEWLRANLHYNHDTGVFTWLTRPAQKIQIGDIAGQISSTGYWRIGICGKRYQAHVLAWAMMTGAWPTRHVDHKNRIKHDNRWDNLRLATPVENSINASLRSDSKSGTAGVAMHRCGKWRAYIKRDGKQKHIGLFVNKEDAIAARIAAAREEYGEFCPQ